MTSSFSSRLNHRLGEVVGKTDTSRDSVGYRLVPGSTLFRSKPSFTQRSDKTRLSLLKQSCHSLLFRPPPSILVVNDNKRLPITVLLRGGATVALSSAAAPAAVAWMGPALLCALSYALYNLFIKKASDSIDPILGGVVLQFVAALLGTCLYVGKRLLAAPANTLSSSTTGGVAATVVASSRSGWAWAVAAGAAVGAAEILSFVISSRGVPATQSLPVIVGGSVLLGTILGTVWLKETLTLQKGWLGVLLIAIGIALVGMDGAGGGH